MKDLPDCSYPGANASVCQIIDLADEYYTASISLFQNADSARRLSRAPARLCSIHAIELYLNAYLRSQGDPPHKIRGHMHNLGAMVDQPSLAKLKFRKKTAAHLHEIAEKREYLVCRYGPELASEHSELNRLTASLVEVATKVRMSLI